MKSHTEPKKSAAGAQQGQRKGASAREAKLAIALKRNLQRRKQAAGSTPQADA